MASAELGECTHNRLGAVYEQSGGRRAVKGHRAPAPCLGAGRARLVFVHFMFAFNLVEREERNVPQPAVPLQYLSCRLQLT